MRGVGARVQEVWVREGVGGGCTAREETETPTITYGALSCRRYWSGAMPSGLMVSRLIQGLVCREYSRIGWLGGTEAVQIANLENVRMRRTASRNLT